MSLHCRATGTLPNPARSERGKGKARREKKEHAERTEHAEKAEKTPKKEKRARAEKPGRSPKKDKLFDSLGRSVAPKAFAPAEAEAEAEALLRCVPRGWPASRGLAQGSG
jgi:hypothetical protein